MMKFSNQEIRDLVYSWIILSLAFTIIFTSSLLSIFKVFVFSLLVVGLAFVFHELAHKLIAQRYGLWAEFRAEYNLLMITLLFALIGLVIAAPGAVIIRGITSREKNGKISLAGPLTNFIIGLGLLGISLLAGGLGQLFLYASQINFYLAFFNMIPVAPFDGFKVYIWNKKIFYFFGIVFLFFLILSWLL